MQLQTRRDFLSLAGKGLGLAALSSATVALLLKNVEAASRNVAPIPVTLEVIHRKRLMIEPSSCVVVTIQLSSVPLGS